MASSSYRTMFNFHKRVNYRQKKQRSEFIVEIFRKKPQNAVAYYPNIFFLLFLVFLKSFSFAKICDTYVHL